MTLVETPARTLDLHAGLAGRLIRSEKSLHPYFQWLEQPSSKKHPPIAPRQSLVKSVETLLAPLRDHSSDAEHRETENANLWIASICQSLIGTRQVDATRRAVVRMIAVALLPLYRCLATNGLQESFAQTRHRLGEGLILRSLIECLELEEIFEQFLPAPISPHVALNQLVGIDLTRVTYLFNTCLPGFNPVDGSFEPNTCQLLTDYRPDEPLPVPYQAPDWANPQTLWALSNELVTPKPDLILPRSWMDANVPWAKISRHWTALERQLVGRSPRDTLNRTVDESINAENHVSENSRNVQAHSRQLANSWNYSLASETIESKPNGNEVLPKILIGEISHLEDPAFVKVIKHQVAVCRAESRSICLSMIVVLAEGDEKISLLTASHENGLYRWQQKLVHWLAEHPDIEEPLAFVTREGQLTLAITDCERNQMTTILRSGLVETLTGSKCHALGDLSLVQLPARFHAGIASTAPRSASFDSQELIASAERCLSVARRVGSASIKSIEVF